MHSLLGDGCGRHCAGPFGKGTENKNPLAFTKAQGTGLSTDMWVLSYMRRRRLIVNDILRTLHLHRR